MSKKVLLGVTGGIACYKAAGIARGLVKKGLSVHTVMTGNACEFIQPLTFDTLTGNTTAVGLFGESTETAMPHIDLARDTDIVLVAPATANFIGKVHAGIADDLLTSVVMASTSKKLIAPAMNTGMYENPVTQRNIRELTGLGYIFIGPGTGDLACGEKGPGRLADVDEIIQAVLKELS